MVQCIKNCFPQHSFSKYKSMFLEAVSYNVPQSGLEASEHRIIRFKKEKGKRLQDGKTTCSFLRFWLNSFGKNSIERNSSIQLPLDLKTSHGMSYNAIYNYSVCTFLTSKEVVSIIFNYPFTLKNTCFEKLKIIQDCIK